MNPGESLLWAILAGGCVLVAYAILHDVLQGREMARVRALILAKPKRRRRK